MKTHDFDKAEPEILNTVKESTGEDNETREKIAALLANGLQTKTDPFPETEKEFRDILAELHELPENDLENRLIISGFIDHPRGADEQRCLECMYFLVHRKWCDIPERPVPVEPDWWCRLWRI